MWRLQALRQASADVHQATRQRVLQAAKQWQQQYQLSVNAVEDDHYAGLLLAFAYPDRIAQQRNGGDGKSHGKFLLANGRGAQLADSDNLAAKNYIVAAELDGQNREARIFLAAEIEIDELRKAAPELIIDVDRIEWSDKDNAVLARREQRLGELVLSTVRLAVNPAQLAKGLCAGIRSKGLAVLPWTDSCQNFLQRSNFLHRVFAVNTATPKATGSQWPLFNDDYLLATLEIWLAPFLTGMQRLSHLEKIDLYAALKNQMSWEQLRELDQLAPRDWQAPTGTNVSIDYSGDKPVIAVRLQEVFGQRDTPRIAGNRVPVLFHLLSPARRPVAVTDDLARFWQVGYPEVKKEMKGRYPKHPWPDDPLVAVPTRHTKNRIS
jgi:ATP-dependent helicase HrpB